MHFTKSTLHTILSYDAFCDYNVSAVSGGKDGIKKTLQKEIFKQENYAFTLIKTQPLLFKSNARQNKRGIMQGFLNEE